MASFIAACWQVLLELAPWLLLGTAVAGLLHVLLPRDFLKSQFTGSSGLWKAVGLGVPLPLCSCAVIPVGLSLKQSGATNGATVAFLISTPQTGVDSVLVSASFLGWPFALFKVASASVMGLIGGWWTDQEQALTLPIVASDNPAAIPPPSRLGAMWWHCLELLRSIWRWLLVGVIASAAITTFLPTTALSHVGLGNPLLAMVVTLIISLPLYVCATASVPIAAALVASGLPVGAALVFLIAGPATNVATIGAVQRVLGRRALAIYLATVISGSIVCGWSFSFLTDAGTVELPHTHEHANGWSIASAIVLLALLGWFALQEFLRWTDPDKQVITSPEHTDQSCCE